MTACVDALKERLQERLVKLNDRLENDYRSFGDAEEVQFEKGRARAYEEVLDLLRRLSPCERMECSYYVHYLAYGGPVLDHTGFHTAERKCGYWQDRAQEYLDKDLDIPTNVEQICRYWENQIRA